MEFLLTKIKENLNEQMLLLTISNPRKAEEIKKYNIRPVLVKDKLMFQSAAYTKTQVFHKNLKKNELVEELERLLPSYKQVQLQTVSSELTALINKKGKAAIKVKKQNNVAKAQMQMDKSHLLHNRTKKYILPEGTVVPFLKDLGVMTAEGKIVRTKYDKLNFYEGSIEEFEGVTQVDMVVTLHACDTATDYAMYKALRWGASVILSVPCCQHELNKQIAASEFEPITDYGILKERFCALATDGIRAKILEEQGYDTQILEFIDMEHTPKNLLIRAIHRKKQSDKKKEKAAQQVDAFCKQFGFTPTLWKLLQEEGEEGGTHDE